MNPRSQKRILVVDDEFNVVNMVRINLEAEGYGVSVAYNGMDALSRIQAEPPDLVVCDIIMPEMDGIELCRKIRKNPSTDTLPFIFLTAKDEVPQKIGGFKAGADDYLTKPFNMDELIARVHAILRRADRVQENSIDRFRHTSQDLNRLSSLGVLAASIAHEVRNQLTTLLTSAELLRFTEDKPKREEYTDVLMEQIDRINRIIVSMLNFARRHKAELKPQSLREIIEEALELTQPRVAAQRAKMDTVLPDTLPSVPVDRQQICQVLINLIINATQAIDTGGRITVRAHERGERVEIQIEDNGCGIPEAVQDRLFAPFTSTKTSSEGIGLGLYISKEIIKAHDGDISVESEAGKGTCFTIRLPVAPAGDTPHETANGRLPIIEDAPSSEQ